MTGDGAAQYADAYEDAGPHQVRKVDVRLLASRRAGIVRVSHGGGAFSDSAGDAYLLTTPLMGAPHVECSYAGYDVRTRTYPGDFLFQPLQSGAHGFAQDKVEIQMMPLDGVWVRELWAETARSGAPDIEPVAARTWRDPLIFNLIERVWAKIGEDGDAAQAWVDAAVMLIVKTLVDRMQRPARPPSTVATLSVRQMERIHALVHDRLGEPLGVPEMAAAANLSLFHFMRTFKRTRGQTPHQYLTMCRINRARELLRGGQISLAEIAYQTGFSSQSHMTTRFQRALGVTPGMLRRMG